MRAVIFDWDLTLWDSWGIHLSLMETTAAQLHQVAPTAEAVAAEFHRPFRQHLLWFFGSAPDAEDELSGIIDIYLTRYRSIVRHRNYLFPGVSSLLHALKRQGIGIGIVSDKIPEFGQSELRQSGLSDLVDFANFKTDARPYKPAPDGLLSALDNLKTEPTEAMYVGDAPQDIVCARSVGTASGAALWSSIDRDATIGEGPSYRLHRPHQVLAAVAAEDGSVGMEPWVRHLPWPWRHDGDNPLDDQDLSPAGSAMLHWEPDPTPIRYWPMGNHWKGRTTELAQLPEHANPIAPLSLLNPDR